MQTSKIIDTLHNIQRYFLYAINGNNAVGDDFDEELLLEELDTLIDYINEHPYQSTMKSKNNALDIGAVSVADKITFDNSNLIIEHLIKHKPDVAEALIN